MEKTRFDYTLLGLVKKDHVTTFNGKGIMELNDAVKTGLANEGLFTKLTRGLAGKEKATIAEKKAILQSIWDMLKEGKLTSGKHGLHKTFAEIADEAIVGMKLTPEEQKLLAKMKANAAKLAEAKKAKTT